MEVIPNVHRIPGVRGANAYLLMDRTLILVDTGMPGNAEAILGYIRGLSLAFVDLARIIITHHHIDHAGSAAAIKRRALPVVSAHPADAPFITGECPQPPPRGVFMHLLFRLVPAMSRFDPVAVDVPLQEGDNLDVLGGGTVIHVPGHTPGAIALHFPEERLLICGDAINRRVNRLGPPPKPFTANMEQAIVSLRRLAELDFEVLCPGHGAPIVGGADEQVRATARELA